MPETKTRDTKRKQLHATLIVVAVAVLALAIALVYIAINTPKDSMPSQAAVERACQSKDIVPEDKYEKMAADDYVFSYTQRFYAKDGQKMYYAIWNGHEKDSTTPVGFECYVYGSGNHLKVAEVLADRVSIYKPEDYALYDDAGNEMKFFGGDGTDTVMNRMNGSESQKSEDTSEEKAEESSSDEENPSETESEN